MQLGSNLELQTSEPVGASTVSRSRKRSCKSDSDERSSSLDIGTYNYSAVSRVKGKVNIHPAYVFVLHVRG
jgi:hypothetical protein